jgi:putative transposase
MARRPRVTVPAFPHHVIQRGNNRQAIFFADADYRYYLDCLQQAKRRYDCRLYAYVLMTNHVHVLLEPSRVEAIGRVMQSVGRRYVRYINATYGRTGTLWEGRYKSAIVGRDEYLMLCSRYIELNPVRAGMVTEPGAYRWSSYRCRALGAVDRLVDEDPWYAGLGASAEERQRIYTAWVGAEVRAGEWEAIRVATQQGRVIGHERFQREVEAMIGRRVVGELRGRPRKRPAESAENVL